jgi:hypothetical protein
MPTECPFPFAFTFSELTFMNAIHELGQLLISEKITIRFEIQISVSYPVSNPDFGFKFGLKSRFRIQIRFKTQISDSNPDLKPVLIQIQNGLASHTLNHLPVIFVHWTKFFN